MKLTVKLDFGYGREIKVGTFPEIGREAGLGIGESEPVIEQVVKSCRHFALDRWRF